MVKRIIIIFLLIISALPWIVSQEKADRFSVSGYITTMQSAFFDSLSGPFLNENLLHNRLNMKGFINNNITLGAELRTRLFTGDMVRSGYYKTMIGEDKGWADMSWNIMNEQSFLLNTTLDRLWIDLNFGKFQATLGRQRINWGQTFVWNPNDIFNAYSFFDFDYIERPGSDALRTIYYPTSTSALELAAKFNNDESITTAALWRFSRWNYDIQFIAGYVNGDDFVSGAGWSGSVGSVSFRGEGSWFVPVRRDSVQTGKALLTTGIDKIFADNSMAQLQIMYCNNPLEPDDFNRFYSGNLSSKDLAFSQFSAFGQFTWAASPLLNLTISGMWFPDLKGYYAGPSIDYSPAENVDFSLIFQRFDSVMGGEKNNINIGFIRVKYSF